MSPIPAFLYLFSYKKEIWISQISLFTRKSYHDKRVNKSMTQDRFVLNFKNCCLLIGLGTSLGEGEMEKSNGWSVIYNILHLQFL